MTMAFIWFLVSLLPWVVVSNYGVSANGGVFHVQHKFAAQQRSPSAMKDHDLHCHQRLLYSIDIPLGGDGKPTGAQLYFTKLKIGSPSKDYYVNVDTGSDLFWVNCIECSQCPKKSGLGVDLTLYDPSKSSTSQIINCDTDFCASVSGSDYVPGCAPGRRCVYQSSYGDASTSSGYFVRDVVQYDRVSGNHQTTPANSSIVLGCGVQQTGRLIESDKALDGILGFGQADFSFFSQMAASGSIKKMFAHCLDSKNGGGIFAMGNIVQPKVKTTALLDDKTHYNVNMEGILVGEQPLPFPHSVIGTSFDEETIIDSGTTLAYVPDDIYTPLVKKIMENHGDLIVKIVDDTFQCFEYNSSLDTDFPKITLSFEGSLQLVVYPHDYLVPYKGVYCIGWQSSATLSGFQDIFLSGDMVLSNKLVLYDVENMTIGWTEYDCSTTIKVQDEESNAIYDVQAHDLSSAHTIKTSEGLHYGRLSVFYSILLLMVLTYTIMYDM